MKDRDETLDAVRAAPDWRRARAEANQAALAAEFGAFPDRLEGIVRQQRRCARMANRRGLVVLAALLLVIGIGLGYYLGLPFLRDYLDGRRLGLLDTIESAEATLAGLDTERAGLVAALAGDSRQTPATLAGDWAGRVEVEVQGAAPAGDGALLAWGDEGILVRYDIAAGTVTALAGDWSDRVNFLGAAPAGDGALLVWGDAGTLVRYDIAAGTATALAGEWPDSVTFTGAAPAGDGALLVWGYAGTLVRYDIASGTATALAGDWPDT